MVVFKSIKPGTKFKSSIFRDKTRQQAERLAPKIKSDFEKTTRTWVNKPLFEQQVSVGRPAVNGLLGSGANKTGVSLEVFTRELIYKFIDEGTRVRYATMSPDFQAKTVPQLIGSRKGKGRLLFVNKNHPRPGIKKREFTVILHRKWQSQFRAEMQRALNEGAIASGHSAR